MCGRFVAFTYEEVAAVVAAVEGRASLRQASSDEHAHARPGSTVYLFGRSAERDELDIADATWGFEVDWSKRPVFNTRVESMLGGSALWRNATEQGRCVIPAHAFFEPHATETAPSLRTGRPVKRQYRFADPSGGPLLLAGVREAGRCSVVTCEPNRWMSPVHDRMPLILRFEEVGQWLSPDWPALADRSDFELTVAPEQPPSAPPQPDQLSLF